MEAKTVVLEVLTVLSRFVVQVRVSYELIFAPPTGSSFFISHSSNVFSFCCISKSNSFCGMVVVLQLVQYCNSNMTLEWPFEVVIKFPSHQEGKYRNMRVHANIPAISIHFETHFVALWVGVEWWGVPVVTILFVYFKV